MSARYLSSKKWLMSHYGRQLRYSPSPQSLPPKKDPSSLIGTGAASSLDYADKYVGYQLIGDY